MAAVGLLPQTQAHRPRPVGLLRPLARGFLEERRRSREPASPLAERQQQRDDSAAASRSAQTMGDWAAEKSSSKRSSRLTQMRPQSAAIHHFPTHAARTLFSFVQVCEARTLGFTV